MLRCAGPRPLLLSEKARPTWCSGHPLCLAPSGPHRRSIILVSMPSLHGRRSTTAWPGVCDRQPEQTATRTRQLSEQEAKTCSPHPQGQTAAGPPKKADPSPQSSILRTSCQDQVSKPHAQNHPCPCRQPWVGSVWQRGPGKWQPLSSSRKRAGSDGSIYSPNGPFFFLEPPTSRPTCVCRAVSYVGGSTERPHSGADFLGLSLRASQFIAVVGIITEVDLLQFISLLSASWSLLPQQLGYTCEIGSMQLD
jgi:hypothetical protein